MTVTPSETQHPQPMPPRSTAPAENESASKAETPRIISGIDLIDFGAGGLYPHRTYLVKGGIGTGKSVVGLQFLTRGLELDEPGILITNQNPEHVLDQARSIGFPLDEPVRRRQLRILNPSNRYFELVESPADVMAILDELRDYVHEVGAKRLVVDPIYSLVTTAYSHHFALTVTQSLLNALEQLPVTTLVIAGDEDNPELNPIVRMIEQNSFGTVSLDPDPATGGRLMRLSKLRYASTEHLAAHYRILDGRGLINYRGEGEHVEDITRAWEGGAERSVMLLGAQPETIRKVKEALGDDFTVAAESDLQTGLAKIREKAPGLVLVTPSSTMTSIRAIADLAKNAPSSVAFLSPQTNRSTDKAIYLRAGADDFITEPFSPTELRARVDALIRRSGRRLQVRDASLQIDPDRIDEMLRSADQPPATEHGAIRDDGGKLKWDDEFRDRLMRNVETLATFDVPFALYWIRGRAGDAEINRDLARLCRQEDVLCYNDDGQFVALLTGTDEQGLTGFENRLDEKLGERFSGPGVARGNALHRRGDSPERLVDSALSH